MKKDLLRELSFNIQFNLAILNIKRKEQRAMYVDKILEHTSKFICTQS